MAAGICRAEYQTRLSGFRRGLSPGSAGLVTEPHNLYYLTGFSGGFSGARAALMATRRSASLLVDFRYLEQARRETDCAVGLWREKGFRQMGSEVARRHAGTLEVDSRHVSYEDYLALRSALKGVSLARRPGVVESMRAHKSAAEAHLIETAAHACDGVMDRVLGWLKPGLTERDVAFEMTRLLREAGLDRTSFDTIVASGPRSSMPHAETGTRRIRAGDLVLIDFGARQGWYCSDMTRTVVMGRAKTWQRDLYGAVLEAQARALAAVRAGVAAAAVDAAAREYLVSVGLGESFGHGVGHGVGLKIHERPTLAPRSRDVLATGHVFTVEPGVYLAGRGGVRIEDLVWLDETGPRVLSGSPKSVLEV